MPYAECLDCHARSPEYEQMDDVHRWASRHTDDRSAHKPDQTVNIIVHGEER